MVYLPWSGILSITYTFTIVSLAHYYSSAFYHEVAKCMLETREEGGSWLIPGLSTALLLFLANDPAKGKKRGTPRGSGFRLLSNDHLDSFHFIVYSFRSYLHITTSLRSLCLPLIFPDLQPYTERSVCNSSVISHKPHWVFSRSRHGRPVWRLGITEDLQMPSRCLRRYMQPCSPCQDDWTCALHGLSF